MVRRVFKLQYNYYIYKGRNLIVPFPSKESPPPFSKKKKSTKQEYLGKTKLTDFNGIEGRGIKDMQKSFLNS